MRNIRTCKQHPFADAPGNTPGASACLLEINELEGEIRGTLPLDEARALGKAI